MINVDLIPNVLISTSDSLDSIRDNFRWLQDSFKFNKVCFSGSLKYINDLLNLSEELNLSPIVCVTNLNDLNFVILNGAKSIKIKSNNSDSFYSKICSRFKGNVFLQIEDQKRSDINKIINLLLNNFNKENINITVSGELLDGGVKEASLLEVKYYKKNYEKLVNSVGYYSDSKDLLDDSSALSFGSDYIEKKVCFSLEKSSYGLNPYMLRISLEKLNKLKSILKYK